MVDYYSMNQHQKILQYLKEQGSISPYDAFLKLGISKLATRISELRRDGYDIKKTLIVYKAIDGKTKRYMSYSLGG